MIPRKVRIDVFSPVFGKVVAAGLFTLGKIIVWPPFERVIASP
jgi:hypothetical protein